MNKNTFIVKVNDHQRQTLQGEIIWAEEDRHQRFRSGLELLKLMNEAMLKTGENGMTDIQDSVG